jgi:hypothetical protein
MASTNLQVLPAPPSLIKSLTAGFDAISNHIGLILFSVALDGLLLFGPRLRLVELFQPLFSQSPDLANMQSPEILTMLQKGLEGLNLAFAFRTFPIGVPSLMVGSELFKSPIGQPVIWQIPSLWLVGGLWLVFTILGLAAGTLYFSVVSQAALSNQVNWQQIFSQWPWSYLQVGLLTAAWYMLIIMVAFPVSCLLSVLLISGLGIGRFTLLLTLAAGSVLIWFLIPLIFSPHGIFAYHRPMWISVRDSIRLTRLTFPSTGLFLLVILVLSEGLNALWNMPPESSWLKLIGITGHAFVSTSLLAASFIYYRDANQWIESIAQRSKVSAA